MTLAHYLLLLGAVVTASLGSSVHIIICSFKKSFSSSRNFMNKSLVLPIILKMLLVLIFFDICETNLFYFYQLDI